MNRRIAWFSLAAFVLALAITGCGGTSSSNPTSYSLGPTGANMVFVKGIALPNDGFLAGFDISYVDATNRQYYLASAQYAGVVLIDLNSLVNKAPSISFITPTGANTFAGNQTDNNDVNAFPGGPNGVVTVNSGAELWAADANTYTGNLISGVASPLADYSNDNCDSSVKVITLSTVTSASPTVTTIPTNGCFKSDELAYDSVDKVVLVANPDEKPNADDAYFGISSTGPAYYTVDIPNATRKANVPEVPFISLISTTSKTVLTQIAFDGTNGTPNADGGIEQSLYSPAEGLFYISIPGNFTDPTDGAIAVVNPTTYAVTTYPLNNCNPTGMVLGPDGKEVFLACNSVTGPQIVSIDGINTGNLISAANQFAAANVPPTDGPSLAIYFGPGCDEAWYNSALNDYMAVCNFSYDNANFTVVNAGTGLTIPGTEAPEIVYTNQNAAISAGAAHSIASDSVTGAVLVPLPAGDPLCLASGGPGCIGVWAPAGSTLQLDAQK